MSCDLWDHVRNVRKRRNSRKEMNPDSTKRSPVVPPSTFWRVPKLDSLQLCRVCNRTKPQPRRAQVARNRSCGMHRKNARGRCTVTQKGKQQTAPTRGVSAAMWLHWKSNYVHADYAPSAVTASLSRSRTIIGSAAAGICNAQRRCDPQSRNTNSCSGNNSLSARQSQVVKRR